MAMMNNRWCNICQATTLHNNMECINCKKRKEDERIANWNSQPIDEKLNDLRERLEKLERGPIRYA